jgi:dolichyl-phosphate beta-glucosyltransferase
MMDSAPDISIVIPCYHAARLAFRSVTELREYLPSTGMTFEVIVVDDGGGDIDALPFEDPRFRLVKLPQNQGKGAAVKAGMREAKGKVRIFTDVDLPYGHELFPVIVYLIREKGFHVVIGDRSLPDSAYATELTASRKLASGVFSFFIGRFVTGGFFDTQCGLKAFRGDVCDELFRLSRIDRFAFDVELVYLTLKHKLDMKRIPVRLKANETSSVRIVRDSLNMLRDVLAIKYRQMKGMYASPLLERIVSEDFAMAKAAASASAKTSKLPSP